MAKKNINSVDKYDEAILKNDWTSLYGYELYNKRTPSEKQMSSYLTMLFGSDFFMEQKEFKMNGKTYFADFYIPKHRCIIEIDGGYHDTFTQIEKDVIRDSDFKSIGINTIRIKNELVNSKSYIKTLLEEKFKQPLKATEPIEKKKGRKGKNKRPKKVKAISKIEIEAKRLLDEENQKKKYRLHQAKLREINDKKYPNLK